MRYFLIPTSILLAFFLEWTVGQKISLWFVPPPFTALVLLYSLWDMKFSVRVWLGVIVGMLFDGISAFPFGTYMVSFVALGVGTTFFRFFFSNVESTLTRSISIGALLCMFFVATPAWGRILGFLSASQNGFLSWGVFPDILGAAALWATVLTILFSSAIAKLQK